MVFTIDDSEPQCSASVSAVRSATLTLTAKDNQMTVYNLKAISCTGGRSSEVLGETYQLDPGPVVEATFPIEGDLSAADLQGDESLLESLLNGIAEVLGLDRERITSVKISDARRRLLAANVILRIVAESQEAADNLAAAARQADFTGIPGPWAIGNPEVTGLREREPRARGARACVRAMMHICPCLLATPFMSLCGGCSSDSTVSAYSRSCSWRRCGHHHNPTTQKE